METGISPCGGYPGTGESQDISTTAEKLPRMREERTMEGKGIGKRLADGARRSRAS
jgi:hypothetical protein